MNWYGIGQERWLHHYLYYYTQTICLHSGDTAWPLAGSCGDQCIHDLVEICLGKPEVLTEHNVCNKPCEYCLTNNCQQCALQVWLGYSGITGYMLYACSARKRIASSVPRLVSFHLYFPPTYHQRHHTMPNQKTCSLLCHPYKPAWPPSPLHTPTSLRLT